jgi:hypothetical protein
MLASGKDITISFQNIDPLEYFLVGSLIHASMDEESIYIWYICFLHKPYLVIIL